MAQNENLNEVLQKYKEQLDDGEPGHDFAPLHQVILSCNERQLLKHFGQVLPLSLKLLKHHHVPFKILGIDCVQHMSATVSLGDLVDRGADDLFVHSLKLQIFHQDVDLIEHLLPCLLSVIRSLKLNVLSYIRHKVRRSFR
ncbi:hypothetical protein HDE_10311 [Halotydeus destructor]|nr:hypothetical protein HDE_10311 [Halotydeus destructor]